ncbi:EpsG family protein [Photorhabdus cinerea]|uniref:EpsG family protein n=1 Tax=Photorhabdus cinerea TaxID=471575 RepID=A0A7X5QCX3_9GAMM|nr:EpsG family protein [Photorhabdus cinerea]
MFIFTLFYCTFYFYLIEKVSTRNKLHLFLWLPPLILYLSVAGLQYSVGTDYLSYISIYENQEQYLLKYYIKGEYTFYYINKLLSFINSPSQGVFFVFSIIQSIFIFWYFATLKRNLFIIWLFFLIFFTVTNIYNNQLNGIRQYAALTLFPLITYWCHTRQKTKTIIAIIVAITFHKSSIMFFIVFLFQFLNKFINKKTTFLFFILTAPIYYFLPFYIIDILTSFPNEYTHYIHSKYFHSNDYWIIVTKIYYIPIILYFFYRYLKVDSYKKNGTDSTYFQFCIFIFSITFWSFLIGLFANILSRLSSNFIFLYIFPIYYILAESINKRNNIKTLFLFLYITLPYIIKVTILAKNEFLYKSYLFN